MLPLFSTMNDLEFWRATYSIELRAGDIPKDIFVIFLGLCRHEGSYLKSTVSYKMHSNGYGIRMRPNVGRC